MRKITALAFALVMYGFIQAQCTTTDATGCQCPDGTTNCDLLPDIIVADEPLRETGNNGVIEYSQTGNGLQNGRLRLSVSTPNIGYGPLTVLTSSQYICGNDTFTTDPGTCPGGGSPRILCYQRVYHKTGNTMTYYDRPAGSMTYHPTHNHMHVDDWGVYTLRSRDTTTPDPLQWPVIGTGAKLGFCLMDYGNCSFYNGHCEDTAGNILLNNDIPNYGLGGGNYTCNPAEQGISAGYVDIYYQYLDDMYLNIPPNVCNGEYYIVVHIDPRNYFAETNENNNVIAIPYTLTRQTVSGNGNVPVYTTQPNNTICSGNSVTLTSGQSSHYLWNTGDTTQSITVTQAGAYSVATNSVCGAGTSDTITVTTIPSQVLSTTAANGCQGQAALQASVTGTAYWYNTDSSTTSIGRGTTFTPATAGTNTYYVESRDTLFGASGIVGVTDTVANGGYYQNDQYQIFSVFKPMLIKSVTVYTNSSKNRIIELRNQFGTTLQSKNVFLDKGVQQVPLNFYVVPGNDYQLGWPIASNPDWYRNSAGANYPYTFSDIMSITGNSSGDLSRWYCYYNWQVEEAPISCTSARVAVPANITAAPAVALGVEDTIYYVYDAPVALTGTPAGGSFSGTGVTGNSFSPAQAGVGGPYIISYQYTDNNTGCTGTASVNITVLDSNTAINRQPSPVQIVVYPNPGKGLFTLKTSGMPGLPATLTVTNMLGQKLWEETQVLLTANTEKNIDLRQIHKGLYYLQISNGRQVHTVKLAIE